MSKKPKELVPPGLLYIADNIISKDNILGVSKEQGAKWAKGLNLPKSAETIFFAGCGYQYAGELESLMSLIRKLDKSAIGAELPMRFAGFQKKLGTDLAGMYRKMTVRGSEAGAQPLLDAVTVLSNFGINLGYLAEEEPCCGASLYFTGLREEFARKAQETYQKLKSLGVKRVIGIVPSCTYALRELIPQCVDGFDLEVRHFSDVVAENISSRELSFPLQVKVTYHDPCQLGRYLGLIDEPREILRAIKGIEFVEVEWTSGEWATCCGGGGGFEAVFPELSEILTMNRVRELVETGAQIIVTQCPGCIMQLKDGLKGIKAENVEVLDLAQIVAMSIGG
ncbi:(Fe-S)-binding protein [Chloroflexota bacterium]